VYPFSLSLSSVLNALRLTIRNIKMVAISLLTLLTSLLPLVSAQNNSAGSTFTNPVLNQVGADPFVAKDDGYYYLTYTTATNITILRSTSLTDWDNADAKLAFDPPVCCLFLTGKQ
jgi:hypothetical protein